MSITLEDSYQKHDTYCTNVKKPSIYYVTEGEGNFIINHEEYEVKKRRYCRNSCKYRIYICWKDEAFIY